jgi:hypothetical protein
MEHNAPIFFFKKKDLRTFIEFKVTRMCDCYSPPKSWNIHTLPKVAFDEQPGTFLTLSVNDFRRPNEPKINQRRRNTGSDSIF